MVSLLTYTHESAKDVHEAYFNRLERFYPEMTNKYTTCNVNVPYTPCLIYNDSDDYWKQMVNALNNVTTDYVIYCQEDYILFDHVNHVQILKYIDLMKIDSTVGFVRLIKSGVGDSIKYMNDLNYVAKYNNPYYFSTQPTIWRVDVLKQMFLMSRVKSIFDEPYNSRFLADMNINGLYSDLVGLPVGGHYNSLVFPYIATAIVKGKWNLSEYPKELELVFNEFDIDKSKRGTV